MLLSIGLLIALNLSAQSAKKFTFDARYGVEHVETTNKGSNFFVARHTKQKANTVGINLNYRLSERFFIKTGFRHTLLTQTVASNFFIECGNTTAQEIALIEARLKADRFNEIALPTAIRYYTYAKNPFVKMYVEGGVDIIFDDNGNVRTGLSLSYGLEVPFGKKIAVFIQPTYRFAFNKAALSERFDPKIQQHNLGFEAGLRF